MRLPLVLLALCLPAIAGEPVRLIVLHTNDLHGNLEPLPPSPVRGVLRGRPAGGFAHLASMVRAARREAEATGAHLLLLDAGDVYQGTPVGNETKGLAVVEAMNALGYDAATLGNHEFDHGLGNLLRLVEHSRFPWLAANLSYPDGELRRVRPYVVLTPPRVPCRVAILGVITPATPYITTPGVTRGLRFADPAGTVRSLMSEVEADLYIVLSHLGRKDDLRLARAVRSIDLIVGGHSHTPVGQVVEGVPVVQTHASGLSLGRVDLDLERSDDGWTVVRADLKLIPVDPRASGKDPAVSEVVEKHAAHLREKLAVVVGSFAAAPRRQRGYHSSPAGSWMADVIRAAGEARIGFMNKGGIRCDLEAGDVTAGDLYRLMPFDNTIVSMDLTGAEVRELIESHLAGDGYPSLEWSGLTVLAERDGKRLVLAGLRIGDEPVEPDRTYRVATNSFLARGGDGYETFRAGRKRKSSGVLLRDALARDLRARSPVTPPAESRLVLSAPAR